MNAMSVLEARARMYSAFSEYYKDECIAHRVTAAVENFRLAAVQDAEAKVQYLLDHFVPNGDTGFFMFPDGDVWSCAPRGRASR